MEQPRTSDPESGASHPIDSPAGELDLPVGDPAELSLESEEIATSSTPSQGLLGRRRRFVIDRRSQLRAGLLTVLLATVLLLLFNLSLHASRTTATNLIVDESPELGAMLVSQNRTELMLMMLASAVFLVGVFVVTVLETHKTHGAAYNLMQRMAEIRDGRYNTQLKLRKKDSLRALEGGFNEMSAALRDRTLQDVDVLESLAELAERMTTEAEARRLASTLHDLADNRRAHAE